MNVQEMKARKKELGYSYAMIARKAGVSIATVKKIFGGEVESPRYETLRKLEAALTEPWSKEVHEVDFKYDPNDTGYTYEDYETFPEYACVEIINGRIYPKYPSESVTDHRLHSMTFQQLANDPRNGSYTYEDYLSFPDDIRVEIIRGKIYAMAAPTFVHQQVVMEVYMQIRRYIDKKGGDCISGVAPLDFKMFEDSLTTVQPDVYIICDRSIVDNQKIQGAPDFIAEIISPSTAAYDKTVKVDEYRDAGVKEYWIVDYNAGKIMVHNFTSETEMKGGCVSYMISIYGMRDQVPVGIYNGDLKIDFAAIDDYIKSIT